MCGIFMLVAPWPPPVVIPDEVPRPVDRSWRDAMRAVRWGEDRVVAMGTRYNPGLSRSSRELVIHALHARVPEDLAPWEWEEWVVPQHGGGIPVGAR